MQKIALYVINKIDNSSSSPKKFTLMCTIYKIKMFSLIYLYQMNLSRTNNPRLAIN